MASRTVPQKPSLLRRLLTSTRGVRFVVSMSYLCASREFNASKIIFLAVDLEWQYKRDMATLTFLEKTRVKTCKACRKRQAKAYVRGEYATVACPCGACVVVTGPLTKAIMAWNVSCAVAW